MATRSYNLHPNIAPLALGPWLADERAVNRGLAIAERIDLTAHIKAYEDREYSGRTSDRPPYEVKDGVAVIAFDGVMMRKPNSMGALFGGVVSTIETERAIALAERDPAVRGIVLDINSPGGYIDGTAALADRVAKAKKPTLAYVGDLCASAALWVASQADWISAGKTAEVGSIGVYTVLEDTSRQDEAEGVAYHVVTSGGVKGLGADGRVTEELLAAVQERVDDIYTEFTAAVAQGRGMTQEQVATIADGRVLMGKKAKAAHLVDAIESFDAAIARMTKGRMAKRTHAPRGAKGEDMSLWDQFKAALGASDAPDGTDTTATTAATANTANTATTAAAEPAINAAAATTGPDAVVVAQTATAAQVDALTSQVAALTAERDAFKATAEKVTLEARDAAKAAAIRAFGQEDAKAHEAAIDAMPFETARAMAAMWNATADKAMGISATEGAKRITTVAKLQTLDVTASDVEGGEDEAEKRYRAMARKAAGVTDAV